MSTGLVYDDRFLAHLTGPTHPERPDRLRAVMERLRSSHLWDMLSHVPAQPAGLRDVLAVHDRGYVNRLRLACESGESYIDSPECPIVPESFDIAMLAAGGAIVGVDAVMAGTSHGGVHNAFCALRPPGHHAERDRAMGFCLLNNVAIAAQHAIDSHKLQRVAVVDFDVHHANGTQHIFESRPDVLVISLHEHPQHLYPGSGYSYEKGTDAGEGRTINLPLDPGWGDREYRMAFLQTVLPALDKFRPELLLVSAGFDASSFDPLAHMKVTVEGFSWMTRQLKMAAERHCHGRLVSVLEGGYDLRSLSECVLAHVGVLVQPEGHDDLMAMKAGIV